MGNLFSNRQDDPHGAESSIQSFISWSEIIGESTVSTTREEDIPRTEDQEPPADSDLPCDSDSNPAYALSTGGATTSLSGEVQAAPRTPEPPVDHDSNPAAYSPRVSDSESITTGGAGATTSFTVPITQETPITDHPGINSM